MIEMLSGADFGSAPIIGILTTRQFADRHQADMLKLLHVWFKTVNYVTAHEDEAANIISNELAKSNEPGVTSGDFKLAWQNFERYPQSPAQAADRILNPQGSNYWKTRQQECSEYFCAVAEIFPAEDDSDRAFLMPEAQASYVARYGRGSP